MILGTKSAVTVSKRDIFKHVRRLRSLLWSASGKKPAQTSTDPLLCLLLPIDNCAKERQLRLCKLPRVCRKAEVLVTCTRTSVPQLWDGQPFTGMMQQQR